MQKGGRALGAFAVKQCRKRRGNCSSERKGVVVIARSIYEWGGGTGQVFLLRVRGRPHPQIFHIWLVATRTASAKSHATFHTSGAWRCESKTSESDTVDDGKPVVKFYARAANPKLEHAVTSFRRGKNNRSKNKCGKRATGSFVKGVSACHVGPLHAREGRTAQAAGGAARGVAGPACLPAAFAAKQGKGKTM
jgi:hypothetical protein